MFKDVRLEQSVITIVVVFVEIIGCQNHAYGSRGKVVNLSPDHRTDVKAVVTAVHVHHFAFAAIVEVNIKRSRHCDNQLVQLLVCMTTSFRAARNIVKVIDSLNIERNMAPAFNEREVSSRVVYSGKVNSLAAFNRHGRRQFFSRGQEARRAYFSRIVR